MTMWYNISAPADPHEKRSAKPQTFVNLFYSFAEKHLSFGYIATTQTKIKK